MLHNLKIIYEIIMFIQNYHYKSFYKKNFNKLNNLLKFIILIIF